MTLKKQIQGHIRRWLGVAGINLGVIAVLVTLWVFVFSVPWWVLIPILALPVFNVITGLYYANEGRKILRSPLFYLLAIQHEFGG